MKLNLDHDVGTIDEEINILLMILKKEILVFEDIQKIIKIIRNYFFLYNRNYKFKSIEKIFRKRFSELLWHCSLQDGLELSTSSYLLSYTLTDNYKSVQNHIYNDIAIPYSNWVSNKWNLDEIKLIQKGEKYIFICRHANVAGGYAPGSSIYTFCKSLLKQNKEVVLIVLGKVDKLFLNLEKEFIKFSIFKIDQKLPFHSKIKMVIGILDHHKPRMILTEIEFELPSILSILGIPIPMIFLSPGYYNLPWYDKIGLTDNLSKNPVGPRKKDFFEIPTFVAPEILDPHIEKQDIRQAKETLGIKNNDFVIGAFARMEKFKKPFLTFLDRLLNHNLNIKIILAGPNNSEHVYKELEFFIKRQRVILLGRSNVHLLGHCLDIGIDTFPTHSGFSIMEIMAKGIPVVSKKDKEMTALGIENQRLNSLTLENENDMFNLICDLIKNRNMTKKLGKECYEFVRTKNADLNFIKALTEAEGLINK